MTKISQDQVREEGGEEEEEGEEEVEINEGGEGGEFEENQGLLGAHFGGRLELLPAEQTLGMEVTPTTIINTDCRRLQAWAGGALGEKEERWQNADNQRFGFNLSSI